MESVSELSCMTQNMPERSTGLNEIHPGIRKDLLTKLIKSTRKETIAVAEYDRDEVAAALTGAIDLKLVLDRLRKKDKLKKGATVAPISENGSMKFTLDRLPLSITR